MPSRVRIRMVGQDGEVLHGPAVLEWVQNKLPRLIAGGWVKDKNAKVPKAWRELPKTWPLLRNWFSEYAPFAKLEIWRERRGTRAGVFQLNQPRITPRPRPARRVRVAEPRPLREFLNPPAPVRMAAAPQIVWDNGPRVVFQQPPAQNAPVQQQQNAPRFDLEQFEQDVEWGPIEI